MLGKIVTNFRDNLIIVLSLASNGSHTEELKGTVGIIFKKLKFSKSEAVKESGFCHEYTQTTMKTNGNPENVKKLGKCTQWIIQMVRILI